MKYTRPAIAFICGFLASCELPSVYYAQSKSGNVVYEKRGGQLGGTRSARRADGSSEVNDYQTSFRDSTMAITSLASTAALKSIGNARQATAQKANARQPTVTTPTVDPATGIVLTPTVTQPPPAVIPNY
jgi:hypothetical protein